MPKPTSQEEKPQTASKANETPPGILPFKMHGVSLKRGGGSQAHGQCPFCQGKEQKFYVDIESGKWCCHRGECQLSGNAVEFLRLLHSRSLSQTPEAAYDDLAEDRGLEADTLYAWGVCQSLVDGEWIVPGYDHDGQLCQLYRYVRPTIESKRVLIATGGGSIPGIGLFGVSLFDSNCHELVFTEGPWDGMALWEQTKGTRNVLAVPGAMSFLDKWVPLFKGKIVSIIYDNDHPKKNEKTGEVIEPTAFAGTKKAAGIMKGVTKTSRPDVIQYLKWGNNGFDPELPHGFDVRDFLASSSQGQTKPQRLKRLLAKLTTVPEEWPSITLGGEEITPLSCTDWKTLLTAWKEAMEWSPGLEKTLVAMLAASISTETAGDTQLWIKVMGPPSCGKTTLCEGIGVAKKYVLSVSTFTGFHSGYKSDKEGEEDHSLIAKLQGKTFITKDGDTLLQAENRAMILAHARDLYDGQSRSHYRHGLNRSYENHKMSWILCGTSSLRELDSAEMGARFLDCLIMDSIVLETERKVMAFSIARAFTNSRTLVNGKSESRDDPKKVKAKRLTGGYVNYIRENAERLLGRIKPPVDSVGECILQHALFVAYMRARPSTKQTEVKEREFGSRLGEQFAKLANCMAAVLGKSIIDTEVVAWIHAIAMDTCRGKTLRIVDRMYFLGEQGAELTTLAALMEEDEDEFRAYMLYLKGIGVVESHAHKKSQFLQTRILWKLTEDVRNLYKTCIIDF